MGRGDTHRTICVKKGHLSLPNAWGGEEGGSFEFCRLLQQQAGGRGIQRRGQYRQAGEGYRGSAVVSSGTGTGVGEAAAAIQGWMGVYDDDRPKPRT